MSTPNPAIFWLGVAFIGIAAAVLLASGCGPPCAEYGPDHLVNSICPVYGGKETLWTPCVKVERTCVRWADQ